MSSEKIGKQCNLDFVYKKYFTFGFVLCLATDFNDKTSLLYKNIGLKSDFL